MKLLSRYVLVRLCVMAFYALLALLALYSLLDFLNEVSNIGKARYTIGTAVQYVLLQMPSHAYQLMPLAVLIGGLIALGQLVGNSEMAVIKASGVSTRNIILILLKFGAIFAVFTILLGEAVAPKLSQRADEIKSLAKTGQVAKASDGMWFKQDNSMILVQEMLPDGTLKGIKIWRYDEQFQLTQMLMAQNAQVMANKWLLRGVQGSRLTDNQVLIDERQDEYLSDVAIDEQLLKVLLVKPEQMSIRELGHYIGYLQENHQKTLAYDVAWWNKWLYPISTVVMSLVALAFTPQSGRHTNMGLKLFGGICLGLLFYFLGRLFGFTSQLYGVAPFVSASLPTVLFGAWAVHLIHKQEKR